MKKPVKVTEGLFPRRSISHLKWGGYSPWQMTPWTNRLGTSWNTQSTSLLLQEIKRHLNTLTLYGRLSGSTDYTVQVEGKERTNFYFSSQDPAQAALVAYTADLIPILPIVVEQRALVVTGCFRRVVVRRRETMRFRNGSGNEFWCR